MRVKILALGLLLAAGAASAQDRVDEQRPLAADGTVVIEIGNGALRVMGWDKATVSVTGTLNSDAERLSVRGDRSKTRVEVVPLRHDHPAGADLEVHVPAGSRVEVESFQAAAPFGFLMTDRYWHERGSMLRRMYPQGDMQRVTPDGQYLAFVVPRA